MSKRNRITNEAVLAQTRSKSCEACGKPGPSDPHHIITTARLGPDMTWNMMALCKGLQGCHRLWHDKPHSEFFKKYPHMVKNLLDRGFLWDDHFNKLILDRVIHPEETWLN
jgi:hypothetical protein